MGSTTDSHHVLFVHGWCNRNDSIGCRAISIKVRMGKRGRARDLDQLLGWKGEEGWALVRVWDGSEAKRPGEAGGKDAWRASRCMGGLISVLSSSELESLSLSSPLSLRPLLFLEKTFQILH